MDCAVNAKKKLTIGLVCGGIDLEHELSLILSKEIITAFNRETYDVVVLGIDKSGNWHFSRENDYLLDDNDLHTVSLNLSKPIVYPKAQGHLIAQNTGQCLATIDVYFPLVVLKEFLCSLEIPYVGQNLYGTYIGMDKDVTKRLLRKTGLPVTPSITLRFGQRISSEDAIKQLGLPIFIKPACLGSSIGVHKVEHPSDFDQTLEMVFTYDRKVLIEQAVEGKEIECAVIGNKNPKAAPVLCEITNLKSFFSYEVKYNSKTEGKLKIPADIQENIAQKIREAAVSAYTLLECDGLARIDFFLKNDDSFFINEINTFPCLGKENTVPRLWQASGVSYHELIEELIELALQRDR